MRKGPLCSQAPAATGARRAGVCHKPADYGQDDKYRFGEPRRDRPDDGEKESLSQWPQAGVIPTLAMKARRKQGWGIW